MTRALRRRHRHGPGGRSSACCRWHSSRPRPPQRPTGDGPIDHAQPTKGAVRLLVSVPGSDSVDYDDVTVSIAGKESTPRPPPRRHPPRCSAPRSWRSTPATAWPATRIAEAKKAALAYLATVPGQRQGRRRSPSTTRSRTSCPRRSTASGREAGHRCADPDPQHRAVRRRARRAQGRWAGRSRRRPAQDPGALGRQGHDEHPPQRRARRDRGSQASASTSCRSQQGDAQPAAHAIAAAGKGKVLDAQRTRRPDRRVRPRGRRARSARSWSRPRCPTGFESTSSNVEVTRARRRPELHRLGVRARAQRRDIEAEKDAAAVRSRSRAGPLDHLPERRAAAASAPSASACSEPSVVLALGCGKPATNLTLTEQIQAYGVMAVPGQSGPQPRRPPRPRSRGHGQAAEKALPTTGPRGAHRAAARGGRARPATGRVAAPARRRSPSAAASSASSWSARATSSSAPGLRRPRSSGPSIYLEAQAQPSGSRPSAPACADTLQLMSGSLSAGLSLAQSIDTIVREGTEPIAERVQARRGREPARRRRSRTRSTASPSAWRAATSPGS